MAPTPIQPPGIAAGPAPGAGGFVGSAHPYAATCSCGKCEGRRAKWRDKARAAYLKRTGAGPSPAPGGVVPPAVPAGAGVPVQPPAPDPSPGPIAWDPALLRPILTEAINAKEKADLRDLISEAEPLGPEAVALVKQEGSWPDPIKVTLVSSGSKCGAKWLNRSGLSAEWADEVAIAGAVAALATSKHILINKLRAMAKRVEEAKAAAASSGPSVHAAN